MGYRTGRKRGNRTYHYYITHTDGVRKEVCCGCIENKTIEKRANELELNDLQQQKRDIDKRVSQINVEMDMNKLSNISELKRF